MQEKQRYFDGRANGTDADSEAVKVRSHIPHFFHALNAFCSALISERRFSSQSRVYRIGRLVLRRSVRDNIQVFHSTDVSGRQLKIDRKAGDSALIAMTQNVSSRLDVRMRKRKQIGPLCCRLLTVLAFLSLDDIPEGLFHQMTTCQTAANEFLRQFWLAMYPPPNDSQALSVATPAQKAAKAAKMAGYLAKTPEKIDALVAMARKEGADPARVQVVSAFPLRIDGVRHTLSPSISIAVICLLWLTCANYADRCTRHSIGYETDLGCGGQGFRLLAYEERQRSGGAMSSFRDDAYLRWSSWTRCPL